MIVSILILVCLVILLEIYQTAVLLVVSGKTSNTERFLYQRGLRTCYRDAEDLRREFSRTLSPGEYAGWLSEGELTGSPPGGGRRMEYRGPEEPQTSPPPNQPGPACESNKPSPPRLPPTKNC